MNAPFIPSAAVAAAEHIWDNRNPKGRAAADGEIEAKIRDAHRKRAERARAKLASGEFDPADRPRLESAIADYERMLKSAPSASADAAPPPAAAPAPPSPPPSAVQPDAAADSPSAPSASAPKRKGLFAQIGPDKSAKALVATLDHALPQIFGPVMKVTEDEQNALAEALAPVLEQLDLVELTPGENLALVAAGIYLPRAFVAWMQKQEKKNPGQVADA